MIVSWGRGGGCWWGGILWVGGCFGMWLLIIDEERIGEGKGWGEW